MKQFLETFTKQLTAFKLKKP